MRTSALAALLLPALMAGCLGGDEPVAVPMGQIDGAVVDQLLRPFANQTVYLSQLGRTDQTSPLGGFTFRDVPVGSYTLLAGREGTQGAAVGITVEADRISKVILQLLPTPVAEPHMAIFPSHSASEDITSWGAQCTSCSWTVVLEGQEPPAEAVFEFHWEGSALGEQGDDRMKFVVLDDKGDLLYNRVADSSPFTATIDGADIPDDAKELRVRAYWGSGFTPRVNFRMESFVTFYYGTTSSEMFSS
ncbi:MAG: carboxypeptidase-like regulatory domain-containing protein [Thermoplasmatota archaeon]